RLRHRFQQHASMAAVIRCAASYEPGAKVAADGRRLEPAQLCGRCGASGVQQPSWRCERCQGVCPNWAVGRALADRRGALVLPGLGLEGEQGTREVRGVKDMDTFRTGLLGRLVRRGLASAAALTLASIIDSHGSARFRSPHILTEPSAWFLHALMLIVFVLIVGAVSAAVLGDRVARRVQVASIVAIAGTVVVAVALGYSRYQSVWGFPLADLVWYFDVFVLAAAFPTFIPAAVLGPPGCQTGVTAE